MADDMTVSQPKKPEARLAARVAKDFGRAVERKAAIEKLELTVTQPDMGEWEIFAFGPYQTPEELQPGRIIRVREKAYIAVVVWMNDQMCRNVTGFGGKIELSFWTSDTQMMVPVDTLNHYCCIKTTLNHCWYVYVWEIEPARAACLYETNICARICNCDDVIHPDYAGFVRHVYDFDPEKLWPPLPPTILPPDFPDADWPHGPSRPASWGFDRPIRYMVYDPEEGCACEPDGYCDEDVVISGP